MEKVAFDLYAHIVNENAKEEDKKSVSLEEEPTTIAEELTTLAEEVTTVAVPSTTQSTTTTTTTTEPPTTQSTTTEVVLTKGRGGLSAGRNSNRFKFQGKERTTTTTEPPAESTSVKNRFNRPSFGTSRTSGSRFSKTTPAVTEEVKEAPVEKSEAPKVSSNKFRAQPARNRFNLRASTEKPVESNDVENTTASRLVRPSRPQFSLRNRGRNGPSSTTDAAVSAVTESNDEQESNTDKPTEKAPIVSRPTSRLNINRPANRANIGTSQTANKIRPSPLNRSRVNANASENTNSDGSKSNENESDPEATTQNNLNKIKSRPRIQINADSKSKKTNAAPVINRKANPLISKRKFGASTTGKI